MWDWDKSNLVIAMVSACPAFLPFASNKFYCAFLLEDHCQSHVVLVLLSILIPLEGHVIHFVSECSILQSQCLVCGLAFSFIYAAAFTEHLLCVKCYVLLCIPQ